MNTQNTRLTAILTALLGLFAGVVRAEDLSGRLGVGGTFGLAGPLGSRAFSEKNSAGADLGAWLRYGLTRRFTIGASWENIDFSRGPGRLRPLQGLVSYQLAPSSRWNPNIHAGLGQAHVRGTGPAELSALGGSAGAGVDVFVWRELSLGASADWLWAAKRPASREINALRGVLNIGWWFGGKAAPTVVASPPAPADTDRDGVWDYQDACPGTPSGVSVDSSGCPLDSDTDGVWDSKDSCPETPAGTLVDIEGCPRASKVSIELKVQFDTAKADVKPEFDEQLQKVADFLRNYPQTLVEIEGHTDNVGSEDSNVALSQRRADAVMAALRDRFGVDASKMKAKGYGPSRPIADNATTDGRASNRRVLATMTAEGR